MSYHVGLYCLINKVKNSRIMENRLKEKIRLNRRKINKRFFYYSILVMSFSIVITTIGVLRRVNKVWIVKEFYDNRDWAGQLYGNKLVLLSDKYFVLYRWHWEVGALNFHGTWDLKGDTLILNGKCKGYDIMGFDNAKYKIYSDSISLIGNQNCIFKHFLNYDKYWRNLIQNDGYIIREEGK